MAKPLLPRIYDCHMDISPASLCILMVIPGLTQAKGGLERVGAKIANLLVERGHNVVIFTCDELKKPPVFELHPNIHLEYYGNAHTQQLAILLRERAQKFHPDLCYILLTGTLFASAWIAALGPLGIPLCISEHSSPEYIETLHTTPNDRYAIFTAVDGIQLLLPKFIDSLPIFLHPKTFVLPNIVDPPSKTSMRTKKKRIIATGRLHPVKQHHLLIEAFGQLAPEFPDWDIMILGDGACRHDLQIQAAKLGISAKIHLPGTVNNVFDYLENAAIFCMPSRFEGFGIAVVEAFFCHLPAVGFAACSGINYLIQDGTNGLLAPEMTAASLATSLRALMKNEGFRESLGKNARVYANELTAEKIFPKLEKHLYRLAACKGKTQFQALCTPEMQKKILLGQICQRVNLFYSDGAYVASLRTSKSWKVSVPLRFFGRIIRCIRQYLYGRKVSM